MFRIGLPNSSKYSTSKFSPSDFGTIDENKGIPLETRLTKHIYLFDFRAKKIDMFLPKSEFISTVYEYFEPENEYFLPDGNV
ncbi:MAG TPA: hypothetical protein PLI56_03855, partial [Exilispira sp.]|nr:hypothetical protein [Exilispira sp.]